MFVLHIFLLHDSEISLPSKFVTYALTKSFSTKNQNFQNMHNQNQKVTPNLTQPFIRLGLIKLVP